MLESIATQRKNYSKIGKYISNKLHHVHQSRTKHSPEQPTKHFIKHKKTHKTEEASLVTAVSTPMVRSKPQRTQPSVGTYKVNYRIVDKNPRNYDFSNTTPHFYREKHKAHICTSYHKDYPDPPPNKQKGLTELKRMTGRYQIKGNIRSQGQNPHQNRFLSRQISPSDSCSKNVSFAKMSPRKDIIEGAAEPLPSYDYNSQCGKKRMDSHIYGFEKQTQRGDVFKVATEFTQDYRTGVKVPLLGRSIDWNRQLSRQGSGQLPGYMETVSSRMGVSLLNLKTMKMNCSNLSDPVPKLSATKLTQSTTGLHHFTSKENIISLD